MTETFQERDIEKRPIKDISNPRYGHGYEYFDWICPTCHKFLSFEPAFDKIPRRCHSCGQLLKRLTRKEAEEDPIESFNIPGVTIW